VATRKPSMPFLLCCALAALSCGGTDTSARPAAARDTLPDGRVAVRYDALPDRADVRVDAELRVGAMEGDPAYVFGDVRSMEADAEGVIYVLDYQASEIRSFDPDGVYLRTIAAKGEGPGEILQANGMILMGDSLLWVQDHAQWRLIGLRLDGEEARRVPMHVLNYGYVWNGTVDEAGRFWKPTNHSDEPFTRDEGLQEARSRSYMVSLDLGSEAKDSVFLGDVTYRFHASRVGETGYRSMGIPHDARVVSIVDPVGGFWMSDGTDYRFARLDEGGDTVLIVEAGVPGPPVTDEDRDEFRERWLEADQPGLARALEEVIAAMPTTKPAITGLLVDDVGRLWVRRSVPAGAAPRYDVFSRDGDHLFGVELGFEPSQFLPPRIRRDRIYALVSDELDVPFVVRAVLRPPGVTRP
jgi:hypothetical protein